MTTVSNAQIKAAMKTHAGVLSMVADSLGVTRQAIWQRVQRSPELQAFKADVEERLLDLAEAGVAKKLISGDGTTQRWFLELKGKGRGYVRRQEQTGADGAPLTAPAPAVHIHVSYVDGQPEPEAEEELL